MNKQYFVTAKSDLQIEPVLQSETLIVRFHRGISRRLVVVFSGEGKDPSHAPKEEFARVATQNGLDSALFIIDPQRSWMNAPMLMEQIVEQVTLAAAEVDATEVLTLGASMGGYAAMLLPAHYPVARVLAFSPQYSVDPDAGLSTGLEDTPWQDHLDALPRHRFAGLDGKLVDRTEYFVLHGGRAQDTAQQAAFPSRDNIHHFVLPEAEANVWVPIRKQADLAELVEHCLDGNAQGAETCLEPTGAYRRVEYAAMAEAALQAALQI